MDFNGEMHIHYNFYKIGSVSMNDRLWKIVCIHLVAIEIVFIYQYSFSDDTIVTLSGDISDVQFDSNIQKYHIDSTVTIPAGKSIVIPEGTIFVFQIGTAFVIDGSCTIDGTATEKVVFTSINDSSYSSSSTEPTPFDWEGIMVNECADSLLIKKLLVKYAKLALNSNAKNITLDSLYQSQSKLPYILIDGNRYMVQNLGTFSYNTQKQIETTVVQSSPSQLLPNEPWWKQKTVQYPLLAIGSSCILASGIYMIGGLVVTSKTKDDHANDLKKASIINGITGVLLLSGFTLTVKF